MHDDCNTASKRRTVPANREHATGYSDSEFARIRISHDDRKGAEVIRIICCAGGVVMVVLRSDSACNSQRENQDTCSFSPHRPSSNLCISIMVVAFRSFLSSEWYPQIGSVH